MQQMQLQQQMQMHLMIMHQKQMGAHHEWYRGGYVIAELKEDDRKSFSICHDDQPLAISRKQKDVKLMLSCTGGQRKKMREEEVKKMCGRARV